MKFIFSILIITGLVFLVACDGKKEEVSQTQKTAFIDPPDWAKEAIWYQIIAERFRNGDPSNDPKPEDLKGAYPGFVPENWEITPWTHDWYKPDPYFKNVKGKIDMAGYSIETFGQLSRLRRYGGDLQGVMDKIDYLDSLGITAVYFNPLSEAPSDHNYDASAWRHIDTNFGPTPKKDVEIIASETPDDPTTWKMTGADKMFVELIARLHERGIRVILDYSWNHTGIEFWAWQDIVKNQGNSKYKDWYWVNEFDDPATPENEFDYRGWFGVKDLPEIKETAYHAHAEAVEYFEGNLASEAAKEHIFNVARKWLDPNGDGDPSDGVDGFRLDVAAEIPLGFWREYRKVVREVNPDAYLLGEIWWEQYPDKLLDPEPTLRGDVFDAVMNYRWYRSARNFFGKAPNEISPSEFVDSLKSYASNLRPQNSYAMMNLAASHDSPRLSTSLFNNNLKYKYQAEPNINKAYKIHKPDAGTRVKQKMLLAQQYTFVGAPHIWAGDEMGMWGADMGDTRKPLIWDDLVFENEVVHPLGLERPVDEVVFDHQLFDYYRDLINIRKKHPVLMHGGIDYILTDDKNKTLAYSRFDEKEEVIAVFNMSDREQLIEFSPKQTKNYMDVLNDSKIEKSGDKVVLTVQAYTAAILVSSE